MDDHTPYSRLSLPAGAALQQAGLRALARLEGTDFSHNEIPAAEDAAANDFRLDKRC